MVGARNATFPKEGLSVKSAPQVVNKIWKLANDIGYGSYFRNRYAASITDDHRFIIENANIPMVDIIHLQDDNTFGDYHHTHSDNIDIVDRRTLKAVGQVVLTTIVNESNL